MNIQVFDRKYRRSAILSRDAENGIYFDNDHLDTKIETGLYSFDFSVDINKDLTGKIEEGYYVELFTVHGKQSLLCVVDFSIDRDKLVVKCEDGSIRFLNAFVDPIQEPLVEEGIEYYYSRSLSGTDVIVRRNEITGVTKQLNFNQKQRAHQRLKAIAAAFGAELSFGVEFEAGKKPIYYVDFLKKRVEDEEGFRITSDDVVKIISKNVNILNVATKLEVLGKVIEETKVDTKKPTTVKKASTIQQATATKYDASKSTAGPLSTSGWNEAEINRFLIDAVDPPHVTPTYIDNFLKTYYSDSPLIGHGKDIKELADYFGISVAAFMGQAAKETTFGRASCGGRYNFTCIMWTNGSPFGKAWAGDRYWINPPNVRSGIAAYMKLARNFYVNDGEYQYSAYLNKFSPPFENNQATFKNIMWGMVKAFGYSVDETQRKKNYSKPTDNPLSIVIKPDETGTIGDTTTKTKHEEMLDKMIAWMKSKVGKSWYSQAQRTGPNSYDCSSSVHYALVAAGFKAPGGWPGSTVTMWGEIGPSKLMVEIPRSQARRGDIFLSGARGLASAGNAGHTGIFLDNKTIIHCTTGNGKSGVMITSTTWTGEPCYCFRLNKKG